MHNIGKEHFKALWYSALGHIQSNLHFQDPNDKPLIDVHPCLSPDKLKMQKLVIDFIKMNPSHPLVCSLESIVKDVEGKFPL
jgi:hypothetical protein